MLCGPFPVATLLQEGGNLGRRVGRSEGLAGLSAHLSTGQAGSSLCRAPPRAVEGRGKAAVSLATYMDTVQHGRAREQRGHWPPRWKERPLEWQELSAEKFFQAWAGVRPSGMGLWKPGLELTADGWSARQSPVQNRICFSPRPCPAERGLGRTQSCPKDRPPQGCGRTLGPLTFARTVCSQGHPGTVLGEGQLNGLPSIKCW